MRYHQILQEKFLRVEVNNQLLTLLVNPTIGDLLTHYEKSTERRLRGLVVGRDVYFWDAYYAYHGHVAALFDPAYPNYNIDNRLDLRPDGEVDPTLDFADWDTVLDHPHVRRLLDSNRIYLYVMGAGWMTVGEAEALHRGHGGAA